MGSVSLTKMKLTSKVVVLAFLAFVTFSAVCAIPGVTDLSNDLDGINHNIYDNADSDIQLDIERASVKAWPQDNTVLKNTYRDMFKANPKLKKDKNLERYAQTNKLCKVYKHSHHSTMDKKVEAYGMKRAEKKAKEEGKNSWGTKYNAILSCTSSDDGCLEKYANWSKENPTQIWYEYRNKKPHWSYILQNKRVGCAANKCGGRGVYLWCYLLRD